MYFKCIIPVGLSKITSNLGNNMKYGIYQIASKTFLSIYKMSVDNIFEKGYLTDNAQCNLQKINIESQKDADLSTIYDNCKGDIYKIANLTDNNIIIDQTVPLSQNSTAHILDQIYETDNNRFALDGITHYLGLGDCSVETAISTLQQYKDYLSSLIPTTTTTTTTTTTESPINSLKNMLESFGISLENTSPMEIAKNISNIFGIDAPDPTISPSDDTNNGGYMAAYIGVAIGLVVLGVGIGYGIKYGIDKYKGKTNINHSEGELQLLANSEIYQIKKRLPSLIQKLKELSENEERYEEIEEDKKTSLDLDYDKLINSLKEFNKTLQNVRDVLQVLNELNTMTDQQHDLNSNICQQTLYKLQKTLQSNKTNPSIEKQSDSYISSTLSHNSHEESSEALALMGDNATTAENYN